MQKELDVACELAVRAGELLLQHYGSSAKVSWKTGGDPVTQADRAASEFLVRELGSHFPGDTILSEEEPDEPGRCGAARIWIIDPMDGTREFIEHREEFAVMIGLAREGKAILGVVYHPAKGKLYAAAAGRGTTLTTHGASVPMRVSSESDPRRMTIAVSRTHPSTAVDAVRHRLGMTRTIACGSIGLKVGLICEGRAHLYLDLSGRTSQWDTCAPAALLQGAGGQITDGKGDPLLYNIRELRHLNGIIASNGTIHQRIVEAVGLG